MNKLQVRDLWSQLRKRRVVRVAWVYLLVSLLVILIATVTFERLSFDPGALELEVHDASGVLVRSGSVERWGPFQTALPAGDYSWVTYRGTEEHARGSFEVGGLEVLIEIERP